MLDTGERRHYVLLMCYATLSACARSVSMRTQVCSFSPSAASSVVQLCLHLRTLYLSMLLFWVDVLVSNWRGGSVDSNTTPGVDKGATSDSQSLHTTRQRAQA